MYVLLKLSMTYLDNIIVACIDEWLFSFDVYVFLLLFIFSSRVFGCCVLGEAPTMCLKSLT